MDKTIGFYFITEIRPNEVKTVRYDIETREIKNDIWAPKSKFPGDVELVAGNYINICQTEDKKEIVKQQALTDEELAKLIEASLVLKTNEATKVFAEELTRYAYEIEELDNSLFVPISKEEFNLADKYKDDVKLTKEDEKRYYKLVNDFCKENELNPLKLTYLQKNAIIKAQDEKLFSKIIWKYTAYNMKICLELRDLKERHDVEILKYVPKKDRIAVYFNGNCTKDNIKFVPNPEGQFIHVSKLPFIFSKFKAEKEKVTNKLLPEALSADLKNI